MKPTYPARTIASPGTLVRTPPLSRREQLRLELLTTVDMLNRRRADQVSEGFVNDYVALRWLEWRGGALHLTETGSDMCDQMRAKLC
jgi:hypothetical protein